MFYAIAILGAFQWSLITKLEPISTALYAYLVLGELLRPSQYAGMGLVLVSLGLYQLWASREKQKNGILRQDLNSRSPHAHSRPSSCAASS